MPKITFAYIDGTSKTVEAKENQSIMQAALENKIEGIEGTCGGCVACATCHVYLHPEWITRVESQDNEQTEEEIDMLDLAENLRTNSRLGCQIKITQSLDGLIVGIPAR